MLTGASQLQRQAPRNTGLKETKRGLEGRGAQSPGCPRWPRPAEDCEAGRAAAPPGLQREAWAS